jgi:glycosyltransferase involved in cell wall biosynthesis
LSKILIVGPAHPFRGGIADLNERLALELKKQGHEVEILSFSLQYPSFLFPGKSQTSEGTPPPGISIHSEINSVNPASWIRAGLKFKKKKFDLVIFRYWLPFFAPAFGTIARLLKSANTRIIAVIDNVIPHEKRPGDYALSRYFLQKCDGFLCMSTAVAEDMKKLGLKQPVVISPHPMYDIYGPAIPRNEALKELGLSDDEKYLLFFGFIRKYKGLDILLEAFAKVKTSGLKLVIAGEYYEDASYYQEIITRFGLKEHIVHFSRFIEDREIPSFFCAANLLVQPYRSATQSGVAQIAYYYNLPMIVTRVGGLAEIVPHDKAGYCTLPDSTEIALAIDNYFTNQRESEMRNYILQYRKRFEWDHFTQQLMSLY